MVQVSSVHGSVIRGVATGGISVYTPKKSFYLTNYKHRTLAFVSSLLAVLFTCGSLTCFDVEIVMTS